MVMLHIRNTYKKIYELVKSPNNENILYARSILLKKADVLKDAFRLLLEAMDRKYKQPESVVPLPAPMVYPLFIRAFENDLRLLGVNRIIRWIRRFFFYSRLHIFDMVYYIVSYDDMVEIVRDWIENIRPQLEYYMDVFDCDDFAVLFKAYVGFKYLLNSVSVNIGYLYRLGELLGGHGWNGFIYYIDNPLENLKLAYIEPQSKILERAIIPDAVYRPYVKELHYSINEVIM